MMILIDELINHLELREGKEEDELDFALFPLDEEDE
jgi:hypothetical protein